jgi:hypothetical protein
LFHLIVLEIDKTIIFLGGGGKKVRATLTYLKHIKSLFFHYFPPKLSSWHGNALVIVLELDERKGIENRYSIYSSTIVVFD